MRRIKRKGQTLDDHLIRVDKEIKWLERVLKYPLNKSFDDINRLTKKLEWYRQKLRKLIDAKLDGRI
jgi:hypothetical protein